MSALPDWRIFPSPEALAAALAGTVAQALAEAIERRGQAFLAVSGGTTPTRFFRALSEQALAWPKVTVTLVDERFVPEDSPRSNAALVRATLLTGKAAAARFAPLYRPAASVGQAADEANAGLAALPLAALVDYQLTFSVPARTTADTGIDALTHAIKFMISVRRSICSGYFRRISAS